jgi:hypothetical protein
MVPECIQPTAGCLLFSVSPGSGLVMQVPVTARRARGSAGRPNSPAQVPTSRLSAQLGSAEIGGVSLARPCMGVRSGAWFGYPGW